MNKFKTLLKRFNVIFLIITIFISSFSLTGCMDKNEIESLAYVVALGIDLDDNNEIIASVEILEMSGKSKTATSNGNSNGSGSPNTDVYISTGSTIYNAIFDLSKRLGKPLKFSNTKCIVIGKRFAENGIEPAIDFVLRFKDPRPTTPLLVTNGKAIDILQAKITGSSTAALAIEDLLKRQKYLGFAATTSAMEYINDAKGENAIATCGVINLYRPDVEDQNKSFILSGSAVFRKYKLIGFINDKETRGMQWLKNKIKLGTILIETPDKNKMSLHILKSNTNLKSSINDKKINIRANIKVTSNIIEMFGNELEDMDFNKNPNLINDLNEHQDKAIYNEVNLAINAAQNRLSADIFQFSNLFYREHPDKWNDIKNNWSELFPTISIEVNVSSQIKQTGSLSKSIDTKDGK